MSGNRTVVDGVLQHVSPSQVTTYERCARKWYFEKVNHLRQPPTAAQARGENLHAQLQTYYETGAQPEHEGLNLVLADARMPPRTEGVLVEHPRDYKLNLTSSGVPMIGRIDLLDIRPGLGEHAPRVVDLKTTSSFRYLKSAEELARNVQLVVYAKYVQTFHVHEGAITLAHANVLSRGTGVKFVTTEPLTRSHVDGMYGAIEDTTKRMLVSARASTFEDVAPNWNACTDFGGCPFLDRCTKRVAEPTGGNEVSLSERMKARRAELGEEAETVVRAQGINPPDAAKPDMPQKPPAPAPAPVTTTQTPAPAPGATSSTSPGTLVLYVDCLPVKGGPSDFVRLEDEIARRADPIARAHGVADVREVKFGEGTATLVGSFRREPLTGIVIATSGGLSSQVVEVLAAQASVVVRGLQ